MTDLDTYKFNRTMIAHGTVGKSARATRWFESYCDLVKFTHGRKVLRTIRLDAAHCGISAEQMACDYVRYGELEVPHHFQVRDADYSYTY
jgi:hypothetical protein